MKKRIIALLTSMTLVISTVLMGCGSAESTTGESEQETAEETTETAQASDKLPEKFKIGVVIWSTTDDLGVQVPDCLTMHLMLSAVKWFITPTFLPRRVRLQQQKI